jgi:hypothetical protein
MYIIDLSLQMILCSVFFFFFPQARLFSNLICQMCLTTFTLTLLLKAYLPTNTCKTSRVKTTAQANDCKVTTKWFGFYRIWKAGNKISDSIELNLPPVFLQFPGL